MTISESAKEAAEKCWDISHREDFRKTASEIIQTAIDNELAANYAETEPKLEQNAREIKRMREALEMVVKICESTKHVDRIGDIRRESNSAIYGLKIGDKVRITKGIYKQPSGDSPGEIHATRGQEATVKEIAKHFFFALVETDHTFFVKADEIEALSPNQPSEQDPTQPNTATGSPARPQSDSVPPTKTP
jgi:hypothetical protein